MNLYLISCCFTGYSPPDTAPGGLTDSTLQVLSSPVIAPGFGQMTFAVFSPGAAYTVNGRILSLVQEHSPEGKSKKWCKKREPSQL